MFEQARRIAPFVVLVTLIAVVGCGATKSKVVPVSGTVTLDGQPLGEGTVYFKTLETGVIETFAVTRGEFSGNAQLGERRVEIYAYRVKTGDFNGMKGEVKESLIPARYNLDSKESAKVVAEGPNIFRFEVVSK